MTKSKNRYYVVWHGKQTGIADTWELCKSWIDGYPGARYKGFEKLDEAKHALHSGYHNFSMQKKDSGEAPSLETALLSQNKPIADSIAVDAACQNNPGPVEYRGVHILTGQQIFHVGPYPLGTVNIGEFLAIVHGLSYLKKYNLSLPIYSDSRTAILWVKTRTIKTSLSRTQNTEELFRLVDRALDWLQNNTWDTPLLKWETEFWGEIPADFGRK